MNDDVDDDQCTRPAAGLNYFNSAAMKPTTWETSESVCLCVCLKNVCLAGHQTEATVTCDDDAL